MKILFAILLVSMLSACHTAAGVLQGAGKDLQEVGKWVEPSPGVDLKGKK
jgi:predicted small secreted protein